MGNHFNIEEAADRADGIAKVTGQAKYTADQNIENITYGVLITSTITKGVIKTLDTKKALKAPGVLDIISHMNCPEVYGYKPKEKVAGKNEYEWRGLKIFYENKIYHYGQAIAVVVANSWENAVAASRLVKVDYEQETFETDFNALRGIDSKLKPRRDYLRGEKDAYKKADVFVEAEYNIPIETHNPIEMHSTIAVWDGDSKLTVYDKSQGPKNTQRELARNFNLDEKNVRVVTEYVGGAFGSALRTWPHTVAACIAAKKVKRPVKIVLNRRQMFTMVGYRPQCWQRIGIGADKAGKLTGITHTAVSNTSRYEEFSEGIVNASQYLYACPNVNTGYKILPLDVNTPTWMRGPGEASGSFALESALDELSYKLNIDPIQLRLINYADVHPDKKLPWSSKFLKECYEAGAKKIGWNNRSPQPAKIKEGDMLVGYGMGGGVFGAGKGWARVRGIVQQDGTIVFQSAVSDMGPGTATAMVSIASNFFKMPVGKISFQLGDTEYPEGPTQGGSTTTSTLGSGVFSCCTELKNKIIKTAVEKTTLFANVDINTIDVINGSVVVVGDESKKMTLADVVKAAQASPFFVEASSAPDNTIGSKYALNSFSAHFVKVLINPSTWEIKLDKVVATGDGGKIINEKTARSQMLGGAVGGIGMALTEELRINQQKGNYENDNLGSYHVPRQLDVPYIDTWFANKPDPVINPIGVKGVGEIALVGFAAAVANAIYNATGKRVRDLPITPAKLAQA